MKQTDEIACIDKVLDGNSSAFAPLMESYAERVWRLVSGIVNDQQLAEEVVQDVFVAAWSNLSRFRGKSSFSTWIYRIAYNKAVSAIRKRTPFVRATDITFIDQADTECEPTFSESDFLHLEAALNQLSATEGGVLRMFYNMRLPIEQIAQVTELSSANVKVIMHRARKKLRVIMDDYERRDFR